jgi:uncharacterized protein (TIGR03083 family)
MTTDPRPWITALRTSHDHLRSVTGPLASDQLRAPSYAADWSIAQVLSHLGSGAEIFGLFLDSALNGAVPPGREKLEPIWERWNDKGPDEQASDALAVDGGFVERVEGLDEAERARVHLALFGTDLDLAGLLQMRLSEHALHTWDVAVALDDRAVVPSDAVDLLVDSLGPLVGRAGRAGGRTGTVEILTTDPDRRFRLEIGTEQVSLTDGVTGEPTTTRLTLPAEAMVRLVYGRLDPAHTPAVRTDGVDLDELRAVFPGF